MVELVVERAEQEGRWEGLELDKTTERCLIERRVMDEAERAAKCVARAPNEGGAER